MCPTQVSGPAGRGLCKQKTCCVSRARAGRCGAQNPRATNTDQKPRMRLSQFVSSISICRRTREGGCEPRSQDFPRNVASYSKWAHAQPGPRHSSWPAPGRSWPDDELSSRAACSNSPSPEKTRPSLTRATNYHHQQSSQHRRSNKAPSSNSSADRALGNSHGQCTMRTRNRERSPRSRRARPTPAVGKTKRPSSVPRPAHRGSGRSFRDHRKKHLSNNPVSPCPFVFWPLPVIYSPPIIL